MYYEYCVYNISLVRMSISVLEVILDKLNSTLHMYKVT